MVQTHASLLVLLQTPAGTSGHLQHVHVLYHLLLMSHVYLLCRVLMSHSSRNISHLLGQDAASPICTTLKHLVNAYSVDHRDKSHRHIGQHVGADDMQ